MFQINQFNFKNKEFTIKIDNFDKISNSPIEILNHKTNNKKLFLFKESSDNYKLFYNKENELFLRILDDNQK